MRLRDIARIELGALDYSTNSFELRKTAVAMLVTQRPGSNALATAKGISDTMAKLKASFPKGLDYDIGYNPTEFIAQSIHELIKTIYEAMALVVIVVLVFLQGWRPAIIPIVAIPVSLVGTFAAMAALGYAINNLTLFGLVLAVGIVVDDAIVVVENVERHLEHGMSRRDAALEDHGGGRRRAGVDRAGACARCSCRPRSWAESPANSSSNSPSPSRSRPRSPASAR